MKLRLPASFLLIFFLQVIGALTLGGCGQRGPLRLPSLPADSSALPAAGTQPVRTTPPAVVDPALK